MTATATEPILDNTLASLNELVSGFDNEKALELGKKILFDPQPPERERALLLLVAQAAARTGDRVTLTEMQARLHSQAPASAECFSASSLLSSLLEIMGDLDMSWKIASSALEIDPPAVFRAAFLIQSASLKFRHGDREHAGAMLSQAESLLMELRNSDDDGSAASNDQVQELLFRIWLSRAVGVMRSGNHPGAMVTISRAISTSGLSDKSAFLGEGFRYQGIIKSAAGEYGEAMDSFSSALSIFKISGDQPRLTRLYSSIGRTFLDAGNTEKASVYFHKSLAIASRLSMLQTCAEVNSMLGHIAMRREDYPQALAYYRDDLRISRGLGNPHAMAHVRHNLGRALRYMGEPDQALEELKEALALFTQIGDGRNSSTVLLRVSDIYAEKEDADAASTYLDRALEILADLGGADREGMIPFIRGRIAALRGNASEALEYLERAEILFMERGLFIPVVEVSHHMALLLAGCHKPREAVHRLNEALKIAQHNRLEKALGRLGDHIEQLENSSDIASELPEKVIREMVRTRIHDLTDMSRLPDRFSGLAICVANLGLSAQEDREQWQLSFEQTATTMRELEKTIRDSGGICSWSTPVQQIFIMPQDSGTGLQARAMELIVSLADRASEGNDQGLSSIACALSHGEFFSLQASSIGLKTSRCIHGPGVSMAIELANVPGISCKNGSYLADHLRQEAVLRKFNLNQGPGENLTLEWRSASKP